MIRLRPSRPDETGRLFDIWHGAVVATHDFLSAEDLDAIARIVRDDYLPVADFWVAAGANDCAEGFLGMTGAKVDALFVDPAAHGRGIGRALMAHARAQCDGPLDVDVNEQNPGAIAFYRRLGFREIGRSSYDDAGRPYPLLHLRQDS